MTKILSPLPATQPNGYSRRMCLDGMEPAEKAIFQCVQHVELLGADPLLTDAVVLLGTVRDKVADWLEGQTGLDAPSTPYPKDATDIRLRIETDIAVLKAGKPSRESSLAVTKLQEAYFWLDEVNRLS